MSVRFGVESPVEQDSASAEPRCTGDSSFLYPLRDGDVVCVDRAITMPPMELGDNPVNPAENPQATVLALHRQIVQLEELHRIAQRTAPGSQAWQQFQERRDQLTGQVGRVVDLFGQFDIIVAPSPERLRQLLNEVDGDTTKQALEAARAVLRQLDGAADEENRSARSVVGQRRVSQAMDAVPEGPTVPWAIRMNGHYALE